jgi:hypothetical protein
MWAAISGLANFFAGLVGGEIAHVLNGKTLVLGGLHLNHYQIVFLISILVRIPGLYLLLGIHDPSAQPVGRLMRGALGWMSQQARSFTTTYRYLGGRLQPGQPRQPAGRGRRRLLMTTPCIRRAGFPTIWPPCVDLEALSFPPERRESRASWRQLPAQSRASRCGSPGPERLRPRP